MDISRTTDTFSLTLEDSDDKISGITIDGNPVVFDNYNGVVAALSPTITVSGNNFDISSYLSFLWDSSETTKVIIVTPTQTGVFSRSVTGDDGVSTFTVTFNINVTEGVVVTNSDYSAILVSGDIAKRRERVQNIADLFQNEDVTIIFTVLVNGYKAKDIINAMFVVYDSTAAETFRYNLGSNLLFDEAAGTFTVYLKDTQSANLIGTYSYELWFKDVDSTDIVAFYGTLKFNQTLARYI